MTFRNPFPFARPTSSSPPRSPDGYAASSHSPGPVRPSRLPRPRFAAGRPRSPAASPFAFSGRKRAPPASPFQPILLQDLARKTRHNVPDGDLSLALRKGLCRKSDQPVTAGNLHHQDREGVDLRLVEPGLDLLPVHVLPGIELRACDRKGLPFQEIVMEVSHREGGTIGGEQNVRALVIGRRGGYQMKLDRPLPQLRRDPRPFR